jgi:hypothetical protein
MNRRDSRVRWTAVTTVPQPPPTTSWDDPAYREAVIDLLGVLAYTELVAFERLASDTVLAPSIGDKAQLAAMAAAEVRHMVKLRERLTALGVDPDHAMSPFVLPIMDFHAKTAPSDWLESLVKAYVGDGIAADFYREMANFVDPDTRALVQEVFEDTGHAAFAVATVRAAIATDPRLAGRLALWGRRLVGEAMSQAQRVAADRDALASLLLGQVGESGGVDLMQFGEMFDRLTRAHTQRMEALGLQS